MGRVLGNSDYIQILFRFLDALSLFHNIWSVSSEIKCLLRHKSHLPHFSFIGSSKIFARYIILQFVSLNICQLHFFFKFLIFILSIYSTSCLYLFASYSILNQFLLLAVTALQTNIKSLFDLTPFKLFLFPTNYRGWHYFLSFDKIKRTSFSFGNELFIK